MTVLDSAAHHKGGQRATIVHRSAENRVFHRQVLDSSVGIAEESRIVGCQRHITDFLSITKIYASESISCRITNGNPALTGHINIGSLLEINTLSTCRNGTVRIDVEPIVFIFKILSLVDTIGQ